MTMIRASAALARSLMAILAIGGAALLAGCGGGSGAPNNPYKSETLPGPLTVLPSTATLYGATPSVFTISGGTPPYRVFSSDSSVLPLSQEVSGNEVVALPANVAADTSLVITARDNTGQSATAEVTVRAAPLVDGLVIAADASPSSCGGAGSDAETSASVVCSGDTGTATVRMTGPGGTVQTGRLVRFDVVQGDFAFFTGNPGQPLAPTLTIATDQTGTAIARFQAGVSAPSGFALMRATDLTTGHQVTGSFTIAQIVSGENTLTVVPETATITAPFKGSCSAGFATDYFVFGGTPPYRVVSTFPQAVSLTNVPVLTNGGSFRATTNGTCVDPLQFAITDATGRTVSAELVNQPGDEDPPAPTPPSELVVSPASVTSAACTGSTFQFVVVGGTPGYNVSASLPGVVIDSGNAQSPQIVRTSGGTFTVSNLTTGSGTIVINAVDSGNDQDQQLATATVTCS